MPMVVGRLWRLRYPGRRSVRCTDYVILRVSGRVEYVPQAEILVVFEHLWVPLRLKESRRDQPIPEIGHPDRYPASFLNLYYMIWMLRLL